MITTALLNLAYFLVAGAIAIFPSGSGLPVEVHDAASYLGQYLMLIDGLIPVATLVVVITVTFSAEIAIFGFRTLKWIFSYLPFIGGRG